MEKPKTGISERVMFWQDLIGAACIGSRRRFSHLTFPEISLIVDPIATPIRELPQGFAAHQDVLINGLQGCIRDVVSLQIFYESGNAETRNFTVLDKWQASIESRLVFLMDSCLDFGVISECCRLATYICCYSVYTDVWSNSFIPMKQAERLLTCLTESLNSPMWDSRQDLFLWLVFVCTSVFQDAESNSRFIRQQHEEFMKLLLVITNSWDNGESCIEKALERFIYVDGWLQSRFSNNHWLALEIILKSAIEG